LLPFSHPALIALLAPLHPTANDLATQVYQAILERRSAQIHPPALLRLDPMFDPLRNDPRFQKLVASSAPKER